MANPHITESETQRALEALKPNKGAGPDGLFPKALKALTPYIAPPLSRILTSLSKPPRSLMTGATAIKARRMLFYLKRSLAALTPNIFLPLYETFIQPHLEYAIQATHPILCRDAEALEKVQKLVLKFV